MYADCNCDETDAMLIFLKMLKKRAIDDLHLGLLSKLQLNKDKVGYSLYSGL